MAILRGKAEGEKNEFIFFPVGWRGPTPLLPIPLPGAECDVAASESVAMKKIGKLCAGKPQARFDEGRLMDDQPGRHVVAACGEASVKVPATGLISASYSTRN